MMFSTSLIFALFGLSSQWVKPIGTRRKLHKYSVTLGRILNLPPQMRNTPSKLLLCGLFNVKRCKEFGGILRMIAGVGPDGTKYDEVCMRTDLERLAAGVEMYIPDDKTGGKLCVIVELHLVGWLADLLGAHGLGPWPESFQARHACRDCWWHSTCWCAYVVEGTQEAKRKSAHAEGCRQRRDRTKDELETDIKYIRTTPFTTKKAYAEACRDRGVSKQYCTLEHLPDTDMSTDAAADTAHLFFLGITRHEIFWMLDDLIRVAKCFTWDELNEQARNVPVMKGHRLPHMERPTTVVGGKGLSSTNMTMTGVEVIHFMMQRCAASSFVWHTALHSDRACDDSVFR
jgi:hypothetical protein